MSDFPIKNILLIEDSKEYRQLLITFFKEVCTSARVDEYDPAKGRPADNFSWSTYDLLILDYDLGKGENGLEWLRHYKTSSGFPPTIILTAEDDEELVVNAVRYGAQGFLRKMGLTKNIMLKAINSALEKYEQEKETASSHKLQVHLFNKEKFFESLKSVRKDDAIILVEIDKFQALHDSLGIFATDNFSNNFIDTILKTTMSSSCSGQMTRIGDSTIALLIQNNTNIESIENLAQNLCTAMSKTEFTNNGKPVNFSVNIGILCIDKDNADVSETLTGVENACRKAREIKGNSYVIEGGQQELAEGDKQFSNEIINAIKENRIQAMFQSLVLVSGMPHKDFSEIYQTRVNIFDPDNNILEAKKFIPILEKTNSLKKLDRWNIRHCISELASLNKDKELKIGILVPLSIQSINDKDLTDWINKLIDYVKIPKLGKSLIFEIRANDFISSHRQAKLQFNKLRVKLNASIALTSVYDQQTLEKCLALEKFDFVLFPPEHTGKEKMQMEDIQKIVDLAREHKATTVANRIDTGEYLALSASAGTDYVLGHFVQPPMEKIIATEEVEVI